MKLEVYELKKEEEKLRVSYIHNSNTSTFYHQFGWRNVVVKTYKHRPVYLAKEGERYSQSKNLMPVV